MANLLSHLFEVTERFGMQTRTELILLQRTMVVVEGVARSLDPQINIWQVARPVVEDYIRASLGPRAMLEDFGRVARILSRYGPLLPEIMDRTLWKAAHQPPDEPDMSSRHRLKWLFTGVLAGAVLTVLAGMALF